MKRRNLLKAALSISLLSFTPPLWSAAAGRSRVRPGDAAWPSQAVWDKLNQDVAGGCIKLTSPFTPCVANPAAPACSEALRLLKNTFSMGDEPALTQTSGWVDAWSSQPSSYAIAAKNTADIVTAVNFARQHNVRLVIKGGGHSYQGTSDSPDSLLLWTRPMKNITLHNDFVGEGCAHMYLPQAAVSLGAGAMWIDAYHAVTTQAGRYVQGGGCTSVGVAGLVQSGGFGNFSKRYGTAAAGLLEAEVVTADGKVRIANACTNADLFWALKGGGGGSLGVVTRLTLRTHELPETFGAVFGKIKSSSDASYKELIAKVIEFYAGALFNAHWGEQIAFNSDNSLDISMVFQGLSQAQADAIWAPFIKWVSAQPEYIFEKPLQSIAIPAQHFWDGQYYQKHFPGLMVADPRPGSPAHQVLWQGDQGEAGWFIHGYQSAWIPESLLAQGRQSQLVTALFNSTRYWRVAFHFNKGLAGAAASEKDAVRNTAMNPNVLNAFALAIIASGGAPEYPHMPRPSLDLSQARNNAQKIKKAIHQLLKVAPGAGCYLSESDYFKSRWQAAFWGDNYSRLASVKNKYDPGGLFFVHHGVGSEVWSKDGFTRVDGS